MPVVKYDVSNVDDAGGFEHVQPGMYIGKISEINLKDSKSGNGSMLEVILQPDKTADGKAVKPKDKKKQVARVYTYVLLEHEPSEWKLKEFVKAVGLKDKGSINTDKLVGTSVQMNLKPDTDLEDRYRPRVGKLMAMPARDGAKASTVAKQVEAEDEAEVDDDLYTEDDLNAMEDDDLFEAAAEFDIKKPAGGMSSLKRKKLVAAILEAQEESEEEDEEEDEEEEPEDEAVEEEDEDEEDEEADEEEEEDELEGLSRTDLKAYIKENELEVRVAKSMSDDDIREAIREAEGIEPEEEAEEEEEDEDEEPVDYNTWSIDALKKEAQERGLSTKGSKKILAGRLSKDDEDEDNPF